IPFRDAHHLVGEQVNAAIADQVSLRSKFSAVEQTAEQWFGNIATATAFGGGCGDPIDLNSEFQAFVEKHHRWLAQWQPAIAELTRAID
ncbi:MAG: hypothetical protein R3309_15565, partial [Reinekea sp.]|nr:hypothetical protein [Reinekea sp.]